MAKIEPITGKYIWVPFDGEEYRIFFEEAGEGIPMVCLHTAGTDSREWRHQLCDPAINKNFRVDEGDIVLIEDGKYHQVINDSEGMLSFVCVFDGGRNH